MAKESCSPFLMQVKNLSHPSESSKTSSCGYLFVSFLVLSALMFSPPSAGPTTASDFRPRAAFASSGCDFTASVATYTL